MLDEQQDVADGASRALVGESLLERPGLAIRQPAEPADIERSGLRRLDRRRGDRNRGASQPGIVHARTIAGRPLAPIDLCRNGDRAARIARSDGSSDGVGAVVDPADVDPERHRRRGTVHVPGPGHHERDEIAAVDRQPRVGGTGREASRRDGGVRAIRVVMPRRNPVLSRRPCGHETGGQVLEPGS